MKLRTQFLAMLVGFMLALSVMVALVARAVFIRYADGVDTAQLTEALSHGFSFAAHQQDNLVQILTHGAARDDTYAFMETRRPEYAGESFGGAFAALRLDLAAWYDRDGKLVLSRGFDRAAGVSGPASPAALEAIGECGFPFGLAGTQRVASGYMWIGQQSWLIGCSPILAGGGEGPSRGVLVAGRRFAYPEDGDLVRIVHESALLVPAQEPGAERSISTSFPDRRFVMGRIRLPSFCGRRPVALQVSLPRQALVQSSINAYYLPGWILICGAAITVLVIWLLDRWILRDVTTSVGVLRAGVAAVAENRNLRLRVTRQRPGEMGDLADGINSMLAALGASQERLQASEALYRSLVEAAPGGIVSLTLDGRIRAANAALAGLAGAPDEAALRGRRLSEAWPVPVARRIESEAGRLAPGESSALADVPEREEKANRWFSVTLTRVAVAAPEKDSILAMIFDVTRRVTAQQEAERRRTEAVHAQRLAALGTLVAGIAHEVNNPNGVINLNMTVMLRMLARLAAAVPDAEGGGPRELEALVRESLSASNRIATLVSSLKKFARQETGLPADLVGLNDVVRQASAWVQHGLKDKACVLKLELADGLPSVRGSSQQLEQVFVNLLQNACEASVRPGSAITVRTALSRESGRLVATVDDEGLGIAASDIDHVFDPFFTTRREAGGTGLGLSISLAIVEAHGGTLAVLSEEGRGARVVLQLPPAKQETDHAD